MGDVELKISDFKHISLDDVKVEDAHYEWQMTFIFCLTMLFYSDSCETETTYIALLTFILGLVINPNK